MQTTSIVSELQDGRCENYPFHEAYTEQVYNELKFSTAFAIFGLAC